MITHLFWSIDGALFNTFPALTYALSKALNQMDVSLPLNVIDGLVRQPLVDSIKSIAARYQLETVSLHERFSEIYGALAPAGQGPFPGVVEVCEQINRKGGFNIVITHHNLKTVESLLASHLMTPLIKDIYSIEQGYRSKPDPEMLVAAIAEHALSLPSIQMICGRKSDAQAGQSAGISTCSVGEQHLPGVLIHIRSYQEFLSMLTVGGNHE